MPESTVTHPGVTVLLPVFNGEQYLADAIQSVLDQSYRDFEFIIIDDGSVDRSLAIAGSFRDSRIRIERNNKNLGLTDTLNRGLDMATGAYLARIDCDDICMPERLERLVDFMQHNPEVGICGSFVQTIDSGNHVWKFPCDDRSIRCRLLFSSCIPHPAAIIRMDAINQHGLRYDSTLQRAQDYDFWVRCSEHMQLANYPEVLVKYRIHNDQIGNLDSGGQQETADLVRQRQLQAMGVNAAAAEFNIHHALSTLEFPSNADFLKHADSWLRTLATANDRNGYFPEPEFRRELTHLLYRVCYTSKRGLRAWKIFRDAPFSAPPVIPFHYTLKLFLRCLVDHAGV